MLYTIVYNMPGYMPEMDPYTVEGTLADALKAIRDEVERMADDDLAGLETASEKTMYVDMAMSYAHIINSIDADFENAANLAEEGVSYHLPNGYVIEAILSDSAEYASARDRQDAADGVEDL